MTGRPTKLTPAVQAIIVDALEQGMPMATAAALAGIHPTQLCEWVARGKGTDKRPSTPLFADFADAVERARAKFEAVCLAEIRAGTTSSGMPDWKARAWILERLHGAKYGQNVVVTAKVDDELRGALDALRSGLDSKTYERVVGILATLGTGTAGPGEPSDGEG